MSNFFSKWRDDRVKAYKNRGFLSKFSDYIVFILILVFAISYAYQSIAKPSDSNIMPTIEVNSTDNKDNYTQTPNTMPQTDTSKPKGFDLFHISTIDIVIVVVLAGAYCYFKFGKNKKDEKEGDV
jgi:hypothetical protein